MQCTQHIRSVSGQFLDSQCKDMINCSQTMRTQTETITPPTFIPYNYYPVNPQELVYAGYDDCSVEAIRYLVEVEGLSVDHPMVQGLRDHLNQQMHTINMPELIHNSMNTEAYQTDSSYRCPEQPDFGIYNPFPVCALSGGSIPKSEVDNVSDGVLKVLQGNNPEAISVAQELLSLLQEERMSLEDMLDDYSDESDIEIEDDVDEKVLAEAEQ